MFLLQSLRNARHLTRLVLVWFVLFVGVAVASPLVHPEGVQMVCTSAGGVKVGQPDADSADALGGGHGLHCPLCLPVAAPPLVAISLPGHAGLSFALLASEQALLASLTGLPWQARAPPVLS